MLRWVRVRVRMVAGLALLGACSCSAEVIWVPPPASSLPSVLVAHSEGERSHIHAVDLQQGSALTLEDVGPDAEVEAAVFSQRLAELGLEEGSVAPSTIEDPVRAGDANEFFRLAADGVTPVWRSVSRISSAFASFPLPVAAPPERCPRFEIEEVVLEPQALIYFGVRGPDDSMLFAGQKYESDGAGGFRYGPPRVFRVGSDGQAAPVELNMPEVPVTGYRSEDETLFADGDGQLYRVTFEADELSTTPVGPPLGTSILALQGSTTSSAGLYALTYEVRGSPEETARLFRLTRDTWELIERLPQGGTQMIAEGQGELVLVSNRLDRAVHFVGSEVRRLLLPEAAAFVGFVPGLGFLAGDKNPMVRFSPGQEGWEPFGPSGNPGLRLRGLTPYRGGFVSVYDTSVAFWSPEVGAFCPPVRLPWVDLNWVEVVGDHLFVYPRSDADSNSMRVYVLRELSRD